MTAYYNEFDEEKAAMLRQLIADGHIAPGDVDERSITDVNASDLIGYDQCHFFAGIGGWSVALRLAGWPDDRPVWTGSCPCQDYSVAGKKERQLGQRHLWPDWLRLIAERKPPKIFGEQVAAAITAGWWDDVCVGLEAEAYACAAAVLPACCVGRPHRRDRVWFVADARNDERGRWPALREVAGRDDRAPQAGQGAGSERQRSINELGNGSAGRDVADAISERGRSWHGERQDAEDANASGKAGSGGLIWLPCPDGKQRPIIDGIRLLVDGLHGRIPILHAFGDAIVPEVAAQIIIASEGWY